MVSGTFFDSYDDQLATWFAGKPEHHGERGTSRSRCVPDFSCCRPHLLSPILERLHFIEASKAERQKMVGVFCQRALVDALPILKDVAPPGVRRIPH